MRCNQCDSLYINGVFCHEHGCPNTNKVFDSEEGIWVSPEPEHDEDPEWEQFIQEAEETEANDPSDRYGHYEGLEEVQRHYLKNDGE